MKFDYFFNLHKYYQTGGHTRQRTGSQTSQGRQRHWSPIKQGLMFCVGTPTSSRRPIGFDSWVGNY